MFRIMQAGRLTETIEIHNPQFNINEFGEQTEQYMYHCTTRAQVIHNSGNRTISNDEILHDYTKTFKIRRYIKISDISLILYNNKKYRVLSIEDNRHTNEKTVIAELINE